jgi:hypothetical protein
VLERQSGKRDVYLPTDWLLDRWQRPVGEPSNQQELGDGHDDEF